MFKKLFNIIEVLLPKMINSIMLLTAGAIIGAIVTIVSLSNYMDQENIRFYVEDDQISRGQMFVDGINQKTKGLRVFAKNNFQVVLDVKDDLFYSESSFADEERKIRLMDVMMENRDPIWIDEASVLYDAIPLNFNYLPKADREAYSVSGTVIQTQNKGYSIVQTNQGELFKVRSKTFTINNSQEIEIIGRLMGYDGNNIPLLRVVWIKK